MKKVLIALTAVVLSFSAMAQTNNMKMKDGCMMKDGKMMMMKDGKMMSMDKDMTMKNGTMVMSSGMVKMKDGKTMMMKNGYCVDMDGKVIKTMKMKHKKKTVHMKM
ncbi:uncharacterized protein YdeI (BOF family) [Pedobacter sp. UYP24]